MTIVIVTFVAIFGIILGAYWFFVLRPDQSAEAELRKRLKPKQEAPLALKQGKLLKPTERLSRWRIWTRSWGA